VSNTSAQLVKLDTNDMDGGDLGNGPISWRVGSHFTGDRSADTIVEGVDVSRTGLENIAVTLYMNNAVAASQTITLPTGTIHTKTVRPMRCSQYRWQLSGQFTIAKPTRTSIYEIVIFGWKDKKRRA
jgi:hypothetical protein